MEDRRVIESKLDDILDEVYELLSDNDDNDDEAIIRWVLDTSKGVEYDYPYDKIRLAIFDLISV